MDENDVLATLPRRSLPAGTPLHHGTDCDGGFEVPDGPAWFARDHATAAYWAGWNVPAHGRADGERRVHGFTTTASFDLIDFDLAAATDEDWERLCLAASNGEEDYLTREQMGIAIAALGFDGWIDEGEIMLSAPAGKLAFLGRTPVPGENDLRPVRSTYRPVSAAA